MATRMLQRRGTPSDWSSANPVLGDGEIGIEKGTKVVKIGDGETAWNQLDPAFETPEVLTVFGRVGEITATSDDLTDKTTIGDALFTAVDAPTARAAIGAGTGNGNVVGAGVTNIQTIGQAAYTALSPKSETTMYVIIGA